MSGLDEDVTTDGLADEISTEVTADRSLRVILSRELDTLDELGNWIALGAVRAPDGGRIVAAVSDPAMPSWEMRGILAEALAMLDEPIDDAGGLE